MIASGGLFLACFHPRYNHKTTFEHWQDGELDYGWPCSAHTAKYSLYPEEILRAGAGDRFEQYKLDDLEKYRSEASAFDDVYYVEGFGLVRTFHNAFQTFGVVIDAAIALLTLIAIALTCEILIRRREARKI